MTARVSCDGGEGTETDGDDKETPDIFRTRTTI